METRTFSQPAQLLKPRLSGSFPSTIKGGPGFPEARKTRAEALGNKSVGGVH